MAGKGKRRREKNYRAAHEGASSRLPPPPEFSSLDALPSKLRKLIALSSSAPSQASPTPSSRGSTKPHVGAQNKVRGGNGEQPNAKNKNEEAKSQNGENDGVNAVNSKKRKKKKTKVDDLRFTAEMEKLGVRSSKRERKKEYFKAKKKKQKGTVPDEFDAPRRDIVKFGETVKAPPKLDSVPRAPKRALAPSKERLRLQAVEAYRSRRKWESRPGLHLPSLVAEEPSTL